MGWPCRRRRYVFGRRRQAIHLIVNTQKPSTASTFILGRVRTSRTPEEHQPSNINSPVLHPFHCETASSHQQQPKHQPIAPRPTPLESPRPVVRPTSKCTNHSPAQRDPSECGDQTKAGSDLTHDTNWTCQCPRHHAIDAAALHTQP